MTPTDPLPPGDRSGALRRKNVALLLALLALMLLIFAITLMRMGAGIGD